MQGLLDLLTPRQVTITQSDIIDTAGITAADGTFWRQGHIVTLQFHGLAGAPKAGSDMQDVFVIPEGFRPAEVHGQLALTWAQSANVTTQRAVLTGAYHMQWRMAAGNAYVTGTWWTNEALPKN